MKIVFARRIVGATDRSQGAGASDSPERIARAVEARPAGAAANLRRQGRGAAAVSDRAVARRGWAAAQRPEASRAAV